MFAYLFVRFAVGLFCSCVCLFVCFLDRSFICLFIYLLFCLLFYSLVRLLFVYWLVGWFLFIYLSIYVYISQAILTRKLIVPEIHDVMKKVCQLSITGATPTVQQQCRQVFRNERGTGTTIMFKIAGTFL